MSTLPRRFRSLPAVAAAALLAVGLAGCLGIEVPVPPPPAQGEDDPAVSGPAGPGSGSGTGSANAGCPVITAGAWGPVELTASAEALLGASTVLEGACSYQATDSTMMWVIALPYDPGFTDRVTAWLEPLGWTPGALGTWSYGGHVSNTGYTAPAGLGEGAATSAFAHVFDAYPEEAAGNLFIGQDFLSAFGVEPGDELAVFAAWR